MQQAHKDDRITFTALTPVARENWSARKADTSKARLRSGLPSSSALSSAPSSAPILSLLPVRPAMPGFDVLISCAFNYEAHATEFSKLGRIPVLKARMNADLHMAENLKNTGKGKSVRHLRRTGH